MNSLDNSTNLNFWKANYTGQIYGNVNKQINHEFKTCGKYMCSQPAMDN